MQDGYEDEYDVAEEDRPAGWRARFGERLSLWAGAVLALAIIAGVAIWSYRLTQRDAAQVPVIHAALTAAKVQPADTGGAETPHQGITSYDAGNGAEGVPAVAFAPPPERPAAEDVAMGRLQEDGSEPGAQPGSEDTGAAAPDTGPPGDGSDLAPTASPVAPSRPADLAKRMAAAQQAVTEEEQLAARAAASKVQIQLGAYPSREQTAAEWNRIYKANEDILAKRALVVQSTISGGRRYFRLRAGPFRDRVEAQNVCRALQARGQDCLVAVNG